MRRRGGISQFRAGLLALIVLVLGIYMSWTRLSVFAHPFEVKAVVAGAPEVHSRTPVRIAGVDVGRVKRVERGPGNAVTITMALEKSALPIHRDAQLKIRTRLFLEGNFFVDLRPGTPEAPVMKDGSVIPLSHTAVPVQLDEILADFQSATRDDIRSLIAELAKALDHGGAQAVNRTLPYLAPAGRGLSRVFEAARGQRDGDLAGAIRYSERTAAAIDSHEAALPDLVTGLNRSARALAARRVQLEASLPELDALLRQARPALEEFRRLTPSAEGFLRDLQPGLRAAPATLRLAGPFLTQADRLIRAVPPLIAQADPALASLARLEPGLADVLHLVTPVTECLRRNAIPTLKTPLDDPPHSTGVPVYQDLLHSLPGQASASQNFDGNGQAIRYHTGYGDQQISFGSLPGSLEPIVGLASGPILGSRPRKPARQPPFEPGVPCTTQRRPDLHAGTGPAPAQTTLAARRAGPRRIDPRQLLGELRRRLGAVKEAVR